MKSLLSGLVTFLVVGVIGVLILRSRGLIPTVSPTPSSSPAGFEMEEATPAPSYSPSPSSQPSPLPSVTPTTKGGQVLGTAKPVAASATTVATTETVTRVKLTLISSDKCPTTATTEVRDIQGELTVRYELKDNYTANVTAWKENGEELVRETRVEDSGELAKISGTSYLKLQMQADHCENNSEHWITITAER